MTDSVKMNFPKSLASIKRIPCLNGWRCISIILVLISHSQHVIGFPTSAIKWVRWLPDGGFGVEFFFVISGFLITYLLMKENETKGAINLRNFYVRRAFRILPAYFVFLVAILALSLFVGYKIPMYSWISLLTYTVNYTYDYDPVIIGHIWSLSVEEQFYIIWPFIFWWFIYFRKNVKWLYIFLLIPIALSPIFRIIGYINHYHFPFCSYSFLNRCDSIAYGCLLALVTATHGNLVEEIAKKYVKYIISIGVILITTILILTRLFLLGPITVPFATSINSLAISLLIIASIFNSESLIFSWLEFLPIKILGVMSYSIYLWQQIFCIGANNLGFKSPPLLLTFPYWLIPVFAVALLSYKFVEKPFLRIKNHYC